MRRYPVFAIVALVFIGITKLLQVTAFDAKQYEKYKKMSFAKVNDKKQIKKKSKKEPEVINLSDSVSQVAENTTQPAFDNENDEAFESSADTPTVDDRSDVSMETSEKNNLDDLKNNYLAPLIASLPTGQLREDIVVRYYRHRLDGNKVYVLRDLGYYIHEKQATETEGLGSNVLIYGDEVTVQDIQIVAYTLLDQGLPLKAIQPTQFSWKSNSLEVGTDTLLLDYMDLSYEDIQNFNK